MADTLQCISPVDGSVYAERSRHGPGAASRIIEAARAAQRGWVGRPQEERIRLVLQGVEADDEAVRLMNDSEFGLTASLWTGDRERAAGIGSRINTGTIFMNRCDYLDPALCWAGRKKTGRGGALSVIGYQNLTRPKSFHMKLR